MTAPEVNAKFFPQDSLWQKHCARVAAYLNAIPPVTSDRIWDSRKDLHPDYLETKS